MTSYNANAIARVCHEANRALQIINDEPDISPPWDEAPGWQRRSAVAGVRRALSGATAAELHEHWCQRKLAEGWVYGPRKDDVAKTHPCLLTYHQLPDEQKVKDRVFNAIVDALS